MIKRNDDFLVESWDFYFIFCTYSKKGKVYVRTERVVFSREHVATVDTGPEPMRLALIREECELVTRLPRDGSQARPKFNDHDGRSRMHVVGTHDTSSGGGGGA